METKQSRGESGAIANHLSSADDWRHVAGWRDPFRLAAQRLLPPNSARACGGQGSARNPHRSDPKHPPASCGHQPCHRRRRALSSSIQTWVSVVQNACSSMPLSVSRLLATQSPSSPRTVTKATASMKPEMVDPLITFAINPFADKIVETGTLDVRVRGNTLFPATVLGRFKILLTELRQLHLLIEISLSKELLDLHPSVFFLDQLSANIPLLRLWWKDTKILFYCHFPDLLLVQGRQKWWKRIWRVGFDWLEGVGMRRADRIVVNSAFTKGVVEQVWKGLGGPQGLGIVYPCVDTANNGKKSHEKEQSPDVGGEEIWKEKNIILSINRFERKKNIELAIRAYAGLPASDTEQSRLVIAGSPNHMRPRLLFVHRIDIL